MNTCKQVVGNNRKMGMKGERTRIKCEAANNNYNEVRMKREATCRVRGRW